MNDCRTPPVLESFGGGFSEKHSRGKLINGVEIQEMILDERLFNVSRNVSAPQDEDRGSHSLSSDTSRGGTLQSSEMKTPMIARSSSSLILPTFAKFDSLKQRYLKKVRESPKASESVN